MGTKHVEYEDSVEIQKILNELLSTLPDSQAQPVNLPLEPNYSTVYTGTESSGINLMGTKNVEYEDSVEIRKILNELLSTLPDSQAQPVDLSLEPNYSTAYTGTESSGINLMGRKNVEHEDSVEIRKILNELLSTLPDSQAQPVDLSLEPSSMDISSDNTQSCKKKGKRNYEDTDGLGNQDSGNYVYISPKKKYNYNENGKNLVYSLLNVFDIEIKFISQNVVPNLQKLRYILNDDKRNTHDDLEKKFNTSILSLRHIISEEIQKINHSDLTAIKDYYDKNIEGNQSVKNINNFIFSFRHTMNDRFNKKEEMYEKVDHFLKILHDSIYEHKFLRNLYCIKSIIINNSIHSKLFSAPFIHSVKTFKNIFELFKLMDELIKIVEKSIKNGFLLKKHNYFVAVQKMICDICAPITTNIRNDLTRLDDILKILNLSYENYSIIIQTIFHFFKEENVKNKKKLRHDINKLYRKNSFRAICDFLSGEEKCILWCYNKASEIFNLNLNEKNKEEMSFNDLVNNENAINNLSSLHEILMRLIGALFIKKQLMIISEIRKSLLNMNSSKKRKHISHKTMQIKTREHQSNLLSQIESERCRMEKVKFSIRNLYLFVNVKKDIEIIKVSNDLENEMKEIVSILRFLHLITCKDDRTKLNFKKKDNTENVLLALYYAYKRLIEFTENET
ncbi:fam-j protein [Plasmodium relictum]|uniref:Fam-j protein n=1 Tax=Plasmodium relictum TaxID=85471 RepID=A0A1J1GKA0_PLARL|nr:fam-j protein [Plasmodium relictum]CRG84891.1 fam-j protein [Plasmodium relictum]